MKAAFAALALLFLLAGCDERLALPKDSVQSVQRVREFIPVGTPKAQAVRKLEARKAFVKEAHGDFDGRELANYLYVDYREAGAIGYSRWQFAIEIVDGRVSAHYCTYGTVSL